LKLHDFSDLKGKLRRTGQFRFIDNHPESEFQALIHILQALVVKFSLI